MTLLLAAGCQPTSSDESLLGYLILFGGIAGLALGIAAVAMVFWAVAMLVGSTALIVHWVRPGRGSRVACAVAGLVDGALGLVVCAALWVLFDLQGACGLVVWVIPVFGLAVWNLRVALVPDSAQEVTP